MHETAPSASGGTAPLDPLAEITYETSRRGFLRFTGRAAALGAAGSLLALSTACSDDEAMGPAARAVVTLPLQSDTDILKYALFLELLEADFYTKAVASGRLSGGVLALATSIRDHEVTHVNALTSALGAQAFGSSDVGFSYGTALNSQASILATAQVLEQTGVGAYLGALGLIQSRALRTTAGSIYTVEARHVAAIRVMTNAAGGPVPAAFESPSTPEAVVNAVVATGFVTKGLG